MSRINQLSELWREYVLFNPERDSDALTSFCANNTLDWLIAQYSKDERKYHNLDHLTYLFALHEDWTLTNEQELIRCLFFFFHDCIYEIGATDNEVASALEASVRMREMGIKEHVVTYVTQAITSSDHMGERNQDDFLNYLLDCDLAILGSVSYNEYVRLIREEYHLIPESTWIVKRMQFLEYMLKKEKIFSSKFIISQGYEERARKNIQQELRNLVDML